MSRRTVQFTPIEVAPLGTGAGKDRYGLISGWRRCSALAQLSKESPAPETATVLALVRQPDQSGDAYLAMVEENEIRVGLSFYERARIVVRTVENRVYLSQTDALRALFASASRAKRSKIKSFITIVAALDGVLRFPQAIGERLGLQLAKALEQDSAFAARLRAKLKAAAADTAEAEQTILRAAMAAPSKEPSQSAKSATATQVAPGLSVRSARNGLTLQGPALDAKLRARLLDWLKSELG